MNKKMVVFAVTRTNKFEVTCYSAELSETVTPATVLHLAIVEHEHNFDALYSDIDVYVGQLA